MTLKEISVALCDLVMDKGDKSEVEAWRALDAMVLAQQTNNKQSTPCQYAVDGDDGIGPIKKCEHPNKWSW
jgi:hypothetical protein